MRSSKSYAVILMGSHGKNYCEFDKVLSEWDSLIAYNCPHNCVNKI